MIGNVSWTFAANQRQLLSVMWLLFVSIGRAQMIVSSHIRRRMLAPLRGRVVLSVFRLLNYPSAVHTAALNRPMGREEFSKSFLRFSHVQDVRVL